MRLPAGGRSGHDETGVDGADQYRRSRFLTVRNSRQRAIASRLRCSRNCRRPTSRLVKTLLPSIQEARQAAQPARASTTSSRSRWRCSITTTRDAGFRRRPATCIGPTARRSDRNFRIAGGSICCRSSEEQALYDQYHFDEPWDSEANKKVLAHMPDVFRSPYDRTRTRRIRAILFSPGRKRFLTARKETRIQEHHGRNFEDVHCRGSEESGAVDEAGRHSVRG